MNETNARASVSGHAKAVEIIGLSKSFGGVTGVANVTLDIRKGEFMTLLGPSGCGKSTLLSMIAGFVAPSEGSIRVDGEDVTGIEPHRRDIGMVFQSYALFPHMNVFDNIAFGLKMRKQPAERIEKDVRRVIAMMKLEGFEHRRVRQLSGGQQQRVALARAIVIQPKVLLLDEPLSALDKNLRTQMQVELSELHRATGLTTIFVTHDQGEALSLSDRIVVMNRGEVQQVAQPVDLYRSPANGFVASFIGEINALPAARFDIGGADMALGFGEHVKLSAPLRPEWTFASGQAVRAFIRPEHVRPAAPLENGPNVIHGKVATHIYQGAHTITRAEVASVGLIEMRTTGSDIIAKQPIGSVMALAIDLREAILLSDA